MRTNRFSLALGIDQWSIFASETIAAFQIGYERRRGGPFAVSETEKKPLFHEVSVNSGTAWDFASRKWTGNVQTPRVSGRSPVIRLAGDGLQTGPTGSPFDQIAFRGSRVHPDAA